MDICYAYIDDVLVASTSEEEQEQHLCFNEYDVFLNPAKCVFGDTEMTFLGYTVSAEGTQPLEEKVAAINRFKRTVLVKFLISFHGMLNFCRRFIPQAASTQAPPHAALAGPKIKGSQSVDWTPTMVHAFEDCKASLSRATLLAHPVPSAMLVLFTDASDTAVVAALQQRVGDALQTLPSTPIRSTQLNKSTVRTAWQCIRPSNTSAIWSKAGPSSY